MTDFYFKKIKKIIRDNFDKNKHTKFLPNKSIIPLASPPYDWEEICEALDSLLSMKTTMGDKVNKFEKMFSKYVGVKHSIMVNSGSSANLIALSILSNPELGKSRIKPGDEIITPAVTWPTTVYPMSTISGINGELCGTIQGRLFECGPGLICDYSVPTQAWLGTCKQING